VGNELGNQLYAEGDYTSALLVYETLSRIQDTPRWQIPAWYQMGLAYERLQQPGKASEIYGRISERAKETDKPDESLMLVIEMARWRLAQIAWKDTTVREARELVRGEDGAAEADVALVKRSK
jgi:tetratricopeptide (TPR) repeat protein